MVLQENTERLKELEEIAKEDDARIALDHLMAEKIMEWTLRGECWYYGDRETFYRTDSPYFHGDWEWWQPTINLEHATLIWEEFTTRGCFYHDAYGQWQVGLDCCRTLFDDCKWQGWGDTLPEAICKAAEQYIQKGAVYDFF